jgi:hypothetical protein
MCRGLDAGNFIGWVLGAVIWVYAASTGMTNAVGWVGAGLTVVFTLGWAYFVLADGRVEPRVVPATTRI